MTMQRVVVKESLTHSWREITRLLSGQEISKEILIGKNRDLGIQNAEIEILVGQKGDSVIREGEIEITLTFMKGTLGSHK